MKRFIVLVIGAVIASLALVSCAVPNSTERVKVIGDNLALLPAGETMILYFSGEDSSFTWVITYEGGSTVHFYREGAFIDDSVDIEVPLHGETKFDPGLFEKDMWVSRQSELAVGIRWEFGLDFQPYKG